MESANKSSFEKINLGLPSLSIVKHNAWYWVDLLNGFQVECPPLRRNKLIFASFYLAENVASISKLCKALSISVFIIVLLQKCIIVMHLEFFLLLC